jgi:hypothetical protein
MPTRRTTANKRERERANEAKAEAKRARREAKANDTNESASVGDDGATDAELMVRLKDLHHAFDQGTLAFDNVHAQTTRLLERIAGHPLLPRHLNPTTARARGHTEGLARHQ